MEQFVIDAGFENKYGMFERRRGSMIHNLMIGRGKFGHGLSVTAARYTHPGDVEYFAWPATGILTASLVYVTQTELEAVCRRWTDVLADWVFPWFESSR